MLCPDCRSRFSEYLAVVGTVTTSGQGEYGRLDSLLVEGVDEVAATAHGDDVAILTPP